jgi:hypothetical protein
MEDPAPSAPKARDDLCARGRNILALDGDSRGAPELPFRHVSAAGKPQLYDDTRAPLALHLGTDALKRRWVLLGPRR